jgi:hypothetical protein
MVQVGMYKQAKYDQGVQKVQNYIDRIAGLDVSKPGHKEYLQSKLNELGSKLRTVAAGDFSNQQLVNSVSGMTGQIVKDPIVQNAVYSTQLIKRGYSEIEAARKAGKSSRNNERDYQDSVNDFMANPDLKASFSGRYTPYKDVNKVAMEAIKALHPKLKSLDIPFVIKDGKISREVADAIRREKITGIDEGQIETAIRAAFTADDYNQLAIDSKYSLESFGAEDLIGRVNSDLEVGKENARKQINFINSQIPKYATDPNQLSELNKRLKYYKEQLGEPGKPGKLDQQAVDDIKQIREGNLNSAKYSMYKDGFFKQFANAFAYDEEEISYVDNPMMQIQLRKDEIAISRAREQRQAKEFEITTALKKKEIDQKDQELYLKGVELGTINPNEPYQLGSETDKKLKSGERLNGQIDNTIKSIDDDVNDLKARGLTDDQITGLVDDYAKNGNKSNVNPAYIATIQSILKNKKNLEALTQLKENTIDEAKKAVYNNPVNVAKLKEENDYINKNFDGTQKVTIKANDGTSIRISEKDMVSLYKSGNLQFNAPKGLQGGTMTLNLNGKNYNVESERFGVGSQETVNNVTKKLKNYYDKFNKVTSNLDEQLQDKYLEMLAPRVGELVPTIRAVNYGKEQKLPVNLANNLSALITAADVKDIAADSKYDRDTASKFLTDENIKNTRVFVQANPDGTYLISIKNDGDPTNIQNLKVTANQVAGTLGAQYLMQNPSEALLLRLGRGTTNINNVPEQAQFQTQFGNFPNINRYQVLADLDEDTKNPNLFVPKFHLLKNDGSYETFVIAGRNKAQRLGLEQSKKSFNELTDDDLIKLLKTEYPTYDFSNLYEK